MTLGNNGNQLAEMMHNSDLLANGLTLEACEAIARKEGIIMGNPKFVTNDDFWEDFICRSEELGYHLSY